ncbi:hypothetical protein [Moorena sp. SIO3H5]|uniref:hypothetical protein n=1 Tax=Moorena sp. SIO3H5 TaxID=2607834 RepID=UPI0013B98A56|nr:hypothetical protein [Moorena sp. SIO3H5]NEO70989.1 hypothetical protein [Moorena sp. SIO3H5]
MTNFSLDQKLVMFISFFYSNDVHRIFHKFQSPLFFIPYSLLPTPYSLLPKKI